MMEKAAKKGRGRSGCLITLSLLLVVLLIGLVFSFTINRTYYPINIPLSPTADIASGNANVAEQIAKIDAALKQSMPASIAYNAPQAMDLDSTVTIELLLNPSVEAVDLGSEVVEPGNVVTATIQVTPRMRAELSSRDTAFVITPLHADAEQFISSNETTRWTWDVTARDGGVQRLTLVVYRLITVDGKESWRSVETYRSDIEVHVSVLQRLMMIDWKWFAGILITALLIPAFWRWADGRSKKRKNRA